MQGKVIQSLLKAEITSANESDNPTLNCASPMHSMLMICQGIAASWYNCVGGESADAGEAALHCILCC